MEYKEEVLTDVVLKKGASIEYSGELLSELLHLPDDAIILKIIPSDEPMYAFKVIFISESDGFKMGEGCVFPSIRLKDKEM